MLWKLNLLNLTKKHPLVIQLVLELY